MPRSRSSRPRRVPMPNAPRRVTWPCRCGKRSSPPPKTRTRIYLPPFKPRAKWAPWPTWNNTRFPRCSIRPACAWPSSWANLAGRCHSPARLHGAAPDHCSRHSDRDGRRRGPDAARLHTRPRATAERHTIFQTLCRRYIYHGADVAPRTKHAAHRHPEREHPGAWLGVLSRDSNGQRRHAPLARDRPSPESDYNPRTFSLTSLPPPFARGTRAQHGKPQAQ